MKLFRLPVMLIAAFMMLGLSGYTGAAAADGTDTAAAVSNAAAGIDASTILSIARQVISFFMIITSIISDELSEACLRLIVL